MRISYGVILTGLLATAGPLTNIQLPEGRPTNLPQDLEALAELMDCGPVPGFFDRPGMVEPPYLYGYVPGWKGNSAVFWCYRSEDEPYLLVAMRDGKILPPRRRVVAFALLSGHRSVLYSGPDWIIPTGIRSSDGCCRRTVSS